MQSSFNGFPRPVKDGGGTKTGDATATASDIVSGKTAYAGGLKLIGSHEGLSVAMGVLVTSAETIKYVDNQHFYTIGQVSNNWYAKQYRLNGTLLWTSSAYSNSTYSMVYCDNKAYVLTESSTGYPKFYNIDGTLIATVTQILYAVRYFSKDDSKFIFYNPGYTEIRIYNTAGTLLLTLNLNPGTQNNNENVNIGRNKFGEIYVQRRLNSSALSEYWIVNLTSNTITLKSGVGQIDSIGGLLTKLG